MVCRSVAALFDIHGNVDALRAVLAEPEVVAADRIVLGGDIVSGPFPVETMELVRSLGERVVAVRGNGEREVAERLTGSDRWVAERLNPADVAALAALPLTRSLTVADVGPVFICHATPDDDASIVTILTPDPDLDRAMAAAPAGLVLCGHVHVRFDRTVGDRRVVNPGSVGMPYEGVPGAYWALIDGDVALRRTEYDVPAAAAKIAESGYPLPELPGWLVDPPAPAEVSAHFEALRVAG